MKRKRDRERDEATAREQAERRREGLLAELKTRLGASPPSEPVQEPEPPQEPDPDGNPDKEAVQ